MSMELPGLEPPAIHPAIHPEIPPAIHGDPVNLFLVDGDRAWDLGPAELDTDLDGTLDALSRTDSDGLTVYCDSDLDNEVDVITHINTDGSYRVSQLTDGVWVETDGGRLR